MNSKGSAETVKLSSETVSTVIRTGLQAYTADNELVKINAKHGVHRMFQGIM